MSVTIHGSELTFIDSCGRNQPTIIWETQLEILKAFRDITGKYWQVEKQSPPNLSILPSQSLTQSTLESFHSVIQNCFFKGFSPYQIHFLEPMNSVLFIPHSGEKKMIFENDPLTNYVFSVKPQAKDVIEHIEQDIDGFPFVRYQKKADQIHGPFEEFFPKSKQVFLRCMFVSGKKHGKQQIFSRDGKLTSESEFENDLLHGFEKVYQDEKLIKIQEHRRGEKTKICREYDLNGNPKH
jgi:hypothetical protein